MKVTSEPIFYAAMAVVVLVSAGANIWFEFRYEKWRKRTFKKFTDELDRKIEEDLEISRTRQRLLYKKAQDSLKELDDQVKKHFGNDKPWLGEGENK